MEEKPEQKNKKSKGEKRLIELSQNKKVGTPFRPLKEEVEHVCISKLLMSKCLSRFCVDIWDELVWVTNLDHGTISYFTLALKCGASKKQDAIVAVKELERQKFIAIIEGGGGSGNTNHYAILWHPIFAGQPYTRPPKEKSIKGTKKGTLSDATKKTQRVPKKNIKGTKTESERVPKNTIKGTKKGHKGYQPVLTSPENNTEIPTEAFKVFKVLRSKAVKAAGKQTPETGVVSPDGDTNLFKSQNHEDLKGETPLEIPPVEERTDEGIKTKPQSQESNSVPSDRWRCTHPTFADLKHVSLDGKGVEEIIKTSEGELTRDNFVKLTLDEIASNLAFWDKQKSEKEILHRSPEKPTPLPGAVAEIPKPKVEVAPRYGRDISKLESLQQGMEVPTEIKAQTLPPAVAEIDPKVKAKIDEYERRKRAGNEFVKTQQVKFLEKIKAMPQEFRERTGFTDEKISELEQAAANRQPFQLSTTPKTTLEEIADEKQLELRQRVEANRKRSRDIKKEGRIAQKEKWFKNHPGATKEDWKLEKEQDKALMEASKGGFRGFYGGPQVGGYSEEEISKQASQFQRAGAEASRLRGTISKEIAAAKPKTPEDVINLEIKGEGAGTIYEQRTKQQYINNKVAKGEWPSKYFKAISRGAPKAKPEVWHGGGPLGFGGAPEVGTKKISGIEKFWEDLRLRDESGKVSPPTVKEIKELGDKLIKGESVSVMETAQDMGFPPGIERANSQDQKATPLLPQNNQVEIGIPDTPPPEKPKAKKSRAKPKEPRDDSVDPLKDTDGLPKGPPNEQVPGTRSLSGLETQAKRRGTLLWLPHLQGNRMQVCSAPPHRRYKQGAMDPGVG